MEGGGDGEEVGGGGEPGGGGAGRAPSHQALEQGQVGCGVAKHGVEP